MYINPLQAIQEGWITHPDCKTLEDWTNSNFISPNAIDITLDKAFMFDHTSYMVLTSSVKQMRNITEVHPITYGDFDNVLPIRGSMDIMSNFYVKLPKDVAAELIIRSTFNRNDIFVTAGIFDSGFCGNIGAVLHNGGPIAYIEPGTRFAQIKFIRSDSEGMYSGGYNTKEGQHWTEISNTVSIPSQPESSVDTDDSLVRTKKSSK